MLIEPRPPHRRDAIAGLQQRPHPFAGAAPDQAQVTAMAARQQLDDGGRFAMPPHAQNDAFVSPFHRLRLPDSGGECSYRHDFPRTLRSAPAVRC
jgi:hypothetical protein